MNPRNALGASAILAAIAIVGGVEAAKLPDCQHRVKTLAGEQIVDPGEMNRFPASEAVGSECEPAPCSVIAGEDPDVDIVDAGASACVRRPSSLIERYRRQPKEVMP